jgi:tetratricopeptide (TPR) repeat protein
VEEAAMRYWIAAAAIVLALAVGQVVLADTIILTNGDRIEGKILEEGDQAVRIQTKYGPVDLPRRSIRRIVREGPAQAEYQQKAAELAKEHVELAQWCAQKGLEEEAKKHYEMALRFDPDNADARKALGFVKKGDEWVKGEEKAEKEPAKPEEETKKEPQKKESEKKEEPAEQLTREEWQRLHQEAIGKLQAKEYDEAEKLYLRIIKAMPNDNVALYNLACLYSLTSKKEKALECLEKSIKAGYTDVGHMQEDSDLDNIRSEEKYKELVKKLIERDKGNMVVWMSDYNEALKKAKEEGKYVIAFFTAGSS